MAKPIHITINRHRDGKIECEEVATHQGPIQGKRLMRLLGVPVGQLYSVSCGGHIQREDGPIEDDEIIWLRDGRQFEQLIPDSALQPMPE